LEVGLTHRRILELTNVPFLQMTPSQVASHTFTRRVFNNQGNFEFYGYYQKKNYLAWVALTRSIIRFYQPNKLLPRRRDLLNLYTRPHRDCCILSQDIEPLTSSFDNIHSECLLDEGRSGDYLITSLDFFEIPALKSSTIPSYFQIQSEIINNNVVIIQMSGDHFILIFGYQKSPIPRRTDIDRIIIWDPSEKSAYSGVSTIPYSELSLYHFSVEETMLPVAAYYLRFK